MSLSHVIREWLLAPVLAQGESHHRQEMACLGAIGEQLDRIEALLQPAPAGAVELRINVGPITEQE